VEDRDSKKRVEDFSHAKKGALQETALWGLYLGFAPVFHQGNKNMISLGKHYKNNFKKFYLASAFRKFCFPEVIKQYFLENIC
jgi:hypothetical protein